MEIECKRKKSENWRSTLLMVAVMVAVLLLVRSRLTGWLLPEGETLEAMAEQLQSGKMPVAKSVFSNLQEWLEDD